MPLPRRVGTCIDCGERQLVDSLGQCESCKVDQNAEWERKYAAYCKKQGIDNEDDSDG